MMTTKRLLDVCDFQGGTQPPKDEWINDPCEGYVRMLQIRDYSQGDAKFIQYVKDTKKLHKCTKDDIMLSRYGYIGQAFIGLEGAYNVALVKVIKKAEIHTPYLLCYFQSYYFQHFLLSNVGARATIPGFNKDELENALIRIPEMCEQIEIASKITKVDELIGFHKQQLNVLDTLIKSRFIEMFGNEIYPVTPLINLIKEGAGLSYGIVQPGNDGTGDMGILRPVDMVDGKISAASIKYISRDIGDSFKKTELTGDELLITVRGTTGITALTDGRFVGMNVTRGIAVIRYDRRKINPIYLKTYLNTDKSQKYIQEHTRGATLQQINLSDLRIQEIPVPPMTRQEKMAAFVEQVDKSKYHGMFAFEMGVAA